jgi:hypothetical protein
MLADHTFRYVLAVFASGAALMPSGALAIDAAIGRKCEIQALEAYPLPEPTNPAVSGYDRSAPALQNYFNDCVRNGGNVPGGPGSAKQSSRAPETTGAASASAPGPQVQPLSPSEEQIPYRPCPAAVTLHGHDLCLGTPGNGYTDSYTIRRGRSAVRGGAANPEPVPYRPCPASVAIRGRNLCLG